MKTFAPCLVLFALAGSAAADVAYSNFGPGDTYHGNGWIVYGPSAPNGWVHGFQFVSQASGAVTSVTVPIQYLGGSPNNFQFELWNDGGNQPGTMLGIVGQTPGYTGGTPPPTQIPATSSITLSSGTTYWVVGRGFGNGQGTWHWNDQNQTGLRAYSLLGGPWNTGTVTLAAFRVEVQGGPPPCYANCDASTSAPVLNVADFTCFLTKFAAGDAYANCDASTSVPVLNVADFTCFLQKFAAGCP
jgi:hypothetical protein